MLYFKAWLFLLQGLTFSTSSAFGAGTYESPCHYLELETKKTLDRLINCLDHSSKKIPLSKNLTKLCEELLSTHNEALNILTKCNLKQKPKTQE